MVDAFEAISFLTRSENRVDVLECLAGGPYTERELVTETGISDVTVGRVLEDFADRGWVAETDDGYTTTRLGDLLAEDYVHFRESMDLACRLGPVRELLPTEEMSFDLRRLTDAKVTDPDSHDVMRALDRWAELIRSADHIRVLVYTGGETVAGMVRDAAQSGTRVEAVVAEPYYRTLQGEERYRRIHREMLSAGAEFYVAEGTDVWYSLATFDDIAAVSGFDEGGSIRVGIEATDDAVYDWVRSDFERHREAARRLSVEDFAE